MPCARPRTVLGSFALTVALVAACATDAPVQVLDHILVGPNVRNLAYQPVHIHAEFADRASDHDPQVVRLRVPTIG